jgi:hypothetical protein
MKMLARIVSALALLAAAAPALPCSDMQQTTTDKKAEKPVVAKADAAKAQAGKPARQASTQVAKISTSKPIPN